MVSFVRYACVTSSIPISTSVIAQYRGGSAVLCRSIAGIDGRVARNLPGTTSVGNTSIGLIFTERRKSELVNHSAVDNEAKSCPFCAEKSCICAGKDDKVAMSGDSRTEGKI